MAPVLVIDGCYCSGFVNVPPTSFFSMWEAGREGACAPRDGYGVKF